MPENGLHQCQSGCFQVCSNCLPEHPNCPKCQEYCIITSKVAHDVLKIIRKHEDAISSQDAVLVYLKDVFDFVQKHREWFAIIVILTAIQYSVSTGIFGYFEILFALLTTAVGGTIGASVYVEDMKEKTEQKTGPAKFGATLFFIFFFPIIVGAGMGLGGMIGLAFGCCSLFIWKLWALGHYIEAVISSIMIAFAVSKLIQHEKYGRHINEICWKVFGRPLF